MQQADRQRDRCSVPTCLPLGYFLQVSLLQHCCACKSVPLQDDRWHTQQATTLKATLALHTPVVMSRYLSPFVSHTQAPKPFSTTMGCTKHT